jgi:hypothetical protein
MSAQKDSADNAKEPEFDFDPDLGDDPEPKENPVAEDDMDADVAIDETGAMSAGTANVGETSVEIDIDELIADIEADSGSKPSSEEGSARKRLEDVLEQRRVAHELEDLEAVEDLDSATSD